MVKMMIKAIAEMKKTHSRMTTILNELEILEDGVGADYSQVVIDYKWLLHECKKRCIFLEERRITSQK